MAGALISGTPNVTRLPGDAARITYYTTDARIPSGGTGRPIAASAMVLTPPGPPPTGGWPVLAWDHGTTGLAESCAPSLTGIGDDPVYGPYLARWLRRGFAIVAPDYPGMGTEGPDLYLNTRAEGLSTLDALRAVTNSDPRFSRNIILAGHSQGAQAAIAAAGLSAQEAPGLHIRGTIAVGAPYLGPQAATQLLARGDGPAVNRSVVNGSGADDPVAKGSSAIVFIVLLGASLHEADPSFDPATAFTPAALPLVTAATTLCLGPLHDAVRKAGLTNATGLRAGAASALAPALAWTAYPTLHLPMPLMMAIGTRDRTVAPEMQRALARDACRAGTHVVERMYPGADHAGSLAASADAAAAFAQGLLRGEAPASTCGQNR